MSYSTFADAGIHINEAHSGNTKTTCPECSDTRVNKDNLCLSVSVDKGTWFCHYCEWTGGLSNGNGNSGKVKSEIATIYDYKDESGENFYINQCGLFLNHFVSVVRMGAVGGFGT